MKREFYCGTVNETQIGKKITVYGWVNKKRELGSIAFIDLRDRTGILQIIINESYPSPQIIKRISNEYILSVTGKIIKRAKPNPDLFSGNVELEAEKIAILAEAEQLPFYPESNQEVSEEIRFKYRYLDLRNNKLQKNFKLRNTINLKVRNYLDKHGFLEIETPILTKATPEGARDYLVPSRIYQGKLFALPQSPQIFKQLLMISGFERYYQIAKCFRDEDLRADRQPEFTQIDIEMSFSSPEELFEIIKGMMTEIYSETEKEIDPEFKIMTFQQVMNKYGTDKPDLRIPLEISDFTEQCRNLQSNILAEIINRNEKIKGLILPDANSYSRKIIEDISDFSKKLGAKGIIWIKHTRDGFKSSLKIKPELMKAFFEKNNIGQNEIIFLLGEEENNSLIMAGKLREYLGKKSIKKDILKFLWVVDFPLFYYNQEEKRLDSPHHPFTSPKSEDINKLDSQPLKVKSIAYDLVLNGVEIGGGSQRINDPKLQKKIFGLLNLSPVEIEEKFGFFLKALQLGAPPHLGIALGLDRIIMIAAEENSIREVIAFPKTTSTLCLLTNSPSKVSDQQLAELNIKFAKKSKKK